MQAYSQELNFTVIYFIFNTPYLAIGFMEEIFDLNKVIDILVMKRSGSAMRFSYGEFLRLVKRRYMYPKIL